MIALVDHLSKKKLSLMVLREKLRLFDEHSNQITPDLATLLKVKTPMANKQKRLNYWKKAQKVLTNELLEDIHQKVIQPNETKELLEELQIFLIDGNELFVDLQFFLIDGWSYPKLYLPLINKYTKEELRALYKKLMRVMSVDSFINLYMFPAIVNEVLYEVEKIYKNLLKVVIFSGIETRDIGVVNYPFQIYEVSIFEEEDYITLSDVDEGELPKNFNFNEYQEKSLLEVYWRAQEKKTERCWSDERI